jgi:hypothetical protein
VGHGVSGRFGTTAIGFGAPSGAHVTWKTSNSISK